MGLGVEDCLRKGIRYEDEDYRLMKAAGHELPGARHRRVLSIPLCTLQM